MMRVERRTLTRQEWAEITSARAGRRGIKASPALLRALGKSEQPGEGGRVEDVTARIEEELRDVAKLDVRDPDDLERSAARLSALAVHLRHEAYRMRHEPELEDRGRAS